MEENMPLLQVRDFPKDIYDEISFEARRQNRTIAQQTIILIKKGLGEDISNQERRRQVIIDIIGRKTPLKAKKIDFVKLIREDRAR